MKAFIEIFSLEFRGLVRSRALAMLSAASVVWMFVAPYVFRNDGTDEGAREMCVRFSLGGVATLLAVALLVTAAGSLSRERAAKRLQLTMVRPVRLFALVVGKIAALSVAGALVLALAATVEAFRQNPSRTCSSVYRPVLPSPADEASTMYEAYMADPKTPPEVKKAKKSVVMRLLTQRAVDHYQTISTNETVTWKFPASAFQTPRHPNAQTSPYAMRFRFTNMYNMRDEVRGMIRTSGMVGVVSNITQAIVTVPLKPSNPQTLKPSNPQTLKLSNPQTLKPSNSQTLKPSHPSNLSFSNEGARAVMLRPRKDVELLVAADGFLANLVRAYLQLVGMLTLLIAFGVFLGAGLSRPVAVFVAVVTLAICEMSPSVVEQYPDQLEKNRIDAIGLALARFSATVTHPVGSLRPLSALAADERIEPHDVARTLLADVVIIPALLAFLAAFLLPRKQDEL